MKKGDVKTSPLKNLKIKQKRQKKLEKCVDFRA